jgi:hypothetical protein
MIPVTSGVYTIISISQKKGSKLQRHNVPSNGQSGHQSQGFSPVYLQSSSSCKGKSSCCKGLSPQQRSNSHFAMCMNIQCGFSSCGRDNQHLLVTDRCLQNTPTKPPCHGSHRGTRARGRACTHKLMSHLWEELKSLQRHFAAVILLSLHHKAARELYSCFLHEKIKPSHAFELQSHLWQNWVLIPILRLSAPHSFHQSNE